MIPLLGLALFGGGVASAFVFKKNFSITEPPANQVATTQAATELVSITETESITPEQEEAEVNYYLKVSGISLGVATVGHLLFPPLAVITLPILGYIAQPLFMEAYRGLKKRELRITLLDSIGVVLGIVVQLYILSAFAMVVYYASMKMLFQSRHQTHQQFSDIFSEQSPSVWLLKDGVEVNVPLEQIQKGDSVIINTGEVIAIDGCIEAGIASIDQHMLTGEAQPEEKEVGDEVFASTIVLAGRITVRVEKTGADTVAANITAVLSDTDNYLTHLQTQGEQMANASVAPTIAIAGATLLLAGPMAMWVVLSSNYAEVMRLTVPLTMLNYLRIASQAGLLIKDGRSLEQLLKIDTVVFDKTGTLTLEQPHVGAIYTNDDFTQQDVLYYTAAAEYRQNHPIARAILKAAEQDNLQLPAVDQAEYKIGYGISIRLADNRLRVGSRRFMQQENITIPVEFNEIEQVAHEQGYSLVYTALDDTLCGVVELHPTLRPEAQHTVQQLQKRGLQVYILSGDHEQPVKNLADALHVDGYIAETLPEDKSRVINEMQQQGKSVCFVGDGINDSIALKKAAVSVSLQDASHVAMDSAQIVLMNKNLLQVLDAIELAQRFAKQQKWGINSTVVTPSVISMGGAMFFGLTITDTFIWYFASAILGTGNATLPLLQENPQQWHSQQPLPVGKEVIDDESLPFQVEQA